MKTAKVATTTAIVENVAPMQVVDAPAKVSPYNVGTGERTRKAGKITFKGDTVEVTQGDKVETFAVDALFQHESVRTHLLQYALVRASTDTAHDKGILGFFHAFASGYTSPAEMERAAKAATQATVATTTNAKGKAALNVAEVITAIEGDFPQVANKLLTLQEVDALKSVAFLRAKLPALDTLLKAREATKAEEEKAAAASALESMWGDLI